MSVLAGAPGILVLVSGAHSSVSQPLAVSSHLCSSVMNCQEQPPEAEGSELYKVMCLQFHLLSIFNHEDNNSLIEA